MSDLKQLGHNTGLMWRYKLINNQNMLVGSATESSCLLPVVAPPCKQNAFESYRHDCYQCFFVIADISVRSHQKFFVFIVRKI